MLFYHEVHIKVTLSSARFDQQVLALFSNRLLTIHEIVQALGLGKARNHAVVRAALGRLIDVGQVESVWWNGARRYRRHLKSSARVSDRG